MVSGNRSWGMCSFVFCLVVGASLGAPAGAAESTDLDAGLELYLRMNGDMEDSSGNDYDGVVMGDLEYAVGISGQAASFDGLDDSVLVPDLPDGLFSQEDFTLSFWFDLPIVPRYSVVSKRPICNSAPFIDLRIEGFRRMEMAIANGEPGASRAPKATYDEGWHHFVGIRRGVELLAYINGVLVDTETTPTLYDIENAIPFGIGTSPCIDVDGTQRLLGRLDELRVHSRALSEAEVQELFLGVIFSDDFESGDASSWSFSSP